jgi:hypothetical protein
MKRILPLLALPLVYLFAGAPSARTAPGNDDLLTESVKAISTAIDVAR